MIKKTLLLAVTLVFAAGTYAQQTGVGSNFQGCDYTEPDDNSTANASSWNALENKLYVTWASRDVQYKKRTVPDVTQNTDMEVRVWRGERVGVEALLYSKTATERLALKADVGGSTITCEPRFMNWVLTDKKQGCGTNEKNTTEFLVADIIDIETTKAIDARTVRPVWVTLEIPRDIDAGSYDVEVNVLKAGDNSTVGTLNLKVTVCDKTLPKPEDQQFFLNFWQQPYAISRYYGVENWSSQHMYILRPYLKMMARAGQKTISAILFYEPWGDQSNDKFQAMIKTTKKNDGTYTYDYTVFDKWVELNMECGITDEIHCFSMIPWDMNFIYYDESGRQHQTGTMSTGSTAYNNFWTAFLTAFASHLKEKGWFDKTYMALDERHSNDVANVYSLIQTLPSDSRFKLSLAGAYNSNLVDKLDDYCLELPNYNFSASEIASRKAKGFRSTVYTCCSAIDPNIITNNNPADGAYLPIHAISNGYDGYLHWSWSNWTDDPLKDCRFKYWGGGDTYLVYPGNRSGVRFERVIEGVQLAEKVRLLREEYIAAGNTSALQTLNTAVAKFTSGTVSSAVSDAGSSASLVNSLQKICNPVCGEYCVPTINIISGKTTNEYRWLSTVTTTGANKDLVYRSTAASENGYVICTDEMQVMPGTSFSLRIVPNEHSDGLQFCRLGVFTDWDGDTNFDAYGEVHGDKTPDTSTGNEALKDLTLSIEVPADAKPGLSRIRLCYTDAWDENEPTACGELLLGFAFDIPVRVVSSSAETAFFLDENNDDISVLTSQITEEQHDAYLFRSLTAGKWNSLMLPVSLDGTSVKKAFGQDVKLSRLTGVKKSSGYTICFKNVNLDTDNPALKAGTLYIIKPGEDMAPLADGSYSFTCFGTDEIKKATITNGSPVVFKLDGVTINMDGVGNDGMLVQSEFEDGTDLGGIQFKGIYIKKDQDNLIPSGSFVLSAGDGVWHHTTSAINTVGGFRSWIDTSNIPLGSKITFSLDGVEDSDVTGIGIIGCEEVPERQSIYSLDGMKMREGQDLNGLAKGIYLINGKKKVIIR